MMLSVFTPESRTINGNFIFFEGSEIHRVPYKFEAKIVTHNHSFLLKAIKFSIDKSKAYLFKNIDLLNWSAIEHIFEKSLNALLQELESEGLALIKWPVNYN